MSSSKSISCSLLLFSLSLLVATYAEPLFNYCIFQDNYTTSAYSPYQTNLNALLNILSTKVPPTGFGLATVGQGQNHLNGLALCRGDVSSSSCKSCVIDAGKELPVRCPNEKGAIVWYDYCLLKYSSESFFGKIDNVNKFYMSNADDVDLDYNPKWFNKKTKELLSRISYKAYYSPKLYATGELELGASKNLYGLAQCTRDLSDADCKKCLDDATSEIPSCCYGKRGARVLGGSCTVRYELYPIVDA